MSRSVPNSRRVFRLTRCFRSEDSSDQARFEQRFSRGECMRKFVRHLVASASAVFLFPALCFAQFGAIAGVVKDNSGAVLPGVTIEASSPTLIEKTRSVASDGAG